MNLKAVAAIIGVFIGCCSSIVFLEYIIKIDPGAGNLVTFSQFLFIATEGFIFTSKCGTVTPKIGLWDYGILVAMFFTTNVLTNYAFNFNIPMPLHLIFRAGSLIANMAMGIIVLKRSYTMSKYISVAMITAGICICTMISGFSVQDKDVSSNYSADYSELFWWTVGIVLLLLALIISARMGLYQEVLYRRYGKHPQEALFYTHLLPLPGFLLIHSSIWDHFLIALSSDPFEVPFIKIGVPIALIYLIANVLTQYICIGSVYVLTTECTSLTVTLVLTLRKFASLLFSILYFQNPFTTWHWVGTFTVFVGTVIFAEIGPTIVKTIASQRKLKMQ